MGNLGGKIDEDESIEDTVKREFIEETKYKGNLKLIPVYVFKTKGFEYYNFIGIVEDEFVPELNWENSDYKWLTLTELLNIKPKHFGLEELLIDEETTNKIKKLIYDR